MSVPNVVSSRRPVLFCGGPAIDWSQWLARPVSPRGEILSWPQLAQRKVTGTFRGRTAIALACELLGIGSGDEVLVPAYNCGSEIDAILHSGASLSAYQISRAGAIDLDDLTSRRTSRTKAVYVIHYFGWEQPLQELRAWCTQQGLSLIEDCALALFSCPEGSLGRVGEAAIYSLPKTFGVGHGGLLSLATSRAVGLPPLVAPGFSTWSREIGLSAKNALMRRVEHVGLYERLLALRGRSRPAQPGPTGEEFPAMPADYNFDAAQDARRALHPRVQALLPTISWEEIVRRRRLNYQRLITALADLPGVTPLFPALSAGVCPLSLPLLVSERDAKVRALQSRGIGALPWWAGFHRKSIVWSQFPDACWLKHQVLTLPVHQGLDAQHMDYVADVAVQQLRRSSLN